MIRQLLTHHSYTLLYLLGEAPTKISAFKSVLNYEKLDRENLTLVNMEMPSGALCHMQASFAADDHSSDPWSVFVKVIGTKGSARFSYNDCIVNAPLEAGCHSHTYTAYPKSVIALDEYVVSEVVAKGAEPLSSVDDAISCLKMLEAIERSIEDGTHSQV